MDKSYILSVIRDFAEERLRVESSNWYWAHDYIQLKSYQKCGKRDYEMYCRIRRHIADSGSGRFCA